MRPSERTVPLFVLTLALAACRTARSPVQPDTGASPAVFPGASAILAGYDAVEPGAAWRAGDRALFALSTASGGDVRAKLIEIELLGSSALALDDSRVATVYETTEITVS